MSLHGKICLVTGASRGIGRGIALALGSEGATVYITGRTLNPSISLPGSLSVTAEELTGRGGVAIPVQCDHGVDEEIYQLFDRIEREHGKLDLLVNNAFKGKGITRVMLIIIFNELMLIGKTYCILDTSISCFWVVETKAILIHST